MGLRNQKGRTLSRFWEVGHPTCRIEIEDLYLYLYPHAHVHAHVHVHVHVHVGASPQTDRPVGRRVLWGFVALWASRSRSVGPALGGYSADRDAATCAVYGRAVWE